MEYTNQSISGEYSFEQSLLGNSRSAVNSMLDFVWSRDVCVSLTYNFVPRLVLDMIADNLSIGCYIFCEELVTESKRRSEREL